MIRAVIDTNFLVSALLSPEGNAALIVQAVKAGLISVFLTDEIADEYAEVLARPKFGFAPDVTSALLDRFHTQGSVIKPSQSAGASPDPGDTKCNAHWLPRSTWSSPATSGIFLTGPTAQVLSISEFLQRFMIEIRS
ncbi:PIN domain-containing protein [Rhodopila sp.]|uniref:PIN domain-containing protein n=1 Tax=Rhodopila sp. TaxID=2480087 RepID=UPI003D10BDB4